MKKRFDRAMISAALLFCLLLSGCSGLSLNSSDLLAPPMADSDRAEIKSLIEESSGGDYSLIYPSSGEYKSAVIFRDMDSDGIEEAVAMYSSGENSSRILFAKRNGGGYEAIGEGVVGSALIDRVDFSDLDGDGTEEFTVSYPDSATPMFSFSVISVVNGVVQADMPASCHTYMTGDFENSGTKDVLLLSLYSTASPATAKLVNYSDGVLSIKAGCEMDSRLSAFSKLSFGGIGEQLSGAFIDGRNSAGEYSTQIIYFDPTAKALLNPLLIYSGYSSTLRTAGIMSGDMDRDGYIEIPVCSMCDYSSMEEVSGVCKKISWNIYSPSSLSLVQKKTAVLCDELGFMLNLSDDKAGAVTARYASPDSAEFYIWEYKDGELSRTDKLLTIKRYKKDSYDSSRIIEAVICEVNAEVYTYTIDMKDSFLAFSDDEVKSSFVLIE